MFHMSKECCSKIIAYPRLVLFESNEIKANISRRVYTGYNLRKSQLTLMFPELIWLDLSDKLFILSEIDISLTFRPSRKLEIFFRHRRIYSELPTHQ